MSMPEMDGHSTYLELRRIDPKVKVILSSGYGRDERIESAIAQGIEAFIKKPFKVAGLAKVVRQVLDER